jgi:purine-binding chemotaxis protein CheW
MDEILELENKNEMQGKHLIFSGFGVKFGLELEYITEILAVQPITPVPNTPAYIKGVMNNRGTIMPVVDMRLMLNHEQTEYTERTCIISLNKDNVHLGLIVDSVEDVISFQPDDILEPPNANENGKNKYLKAIGKSGSEAIQILDIVKIYET